MLDFFKKLLEIALDALLQAAIAFGLGTGGAAIACWYYDIPLGFSILGGILALGIALAFKSYSIFD